MGADVGTVAAASPAVSLKTMGPAENCDEGGSAKFRRTIGL